MKAAMSDTRWRSRIAPASCDTLVTIEQLAERRRVIFAKNSDRSGLECQPLFYSPRLTHGAGAELNCQYLRIPQARETLGILGSRPWWLWGFEHGVNEAGVAIGNEALFTREEIPPVGLLGMDLVRLGLERGHSASEAVTVITTLLEQHGQGGPAVRAGGSYHNSFLIADPTEAWILETSGRHWVGRRVRSRAAISNLATIEDDWEIASNGIDAYARSRGWWKTTNSTRLNFRAAFEDPSMRYIGEDRYRASCAFLAGPDALDIKDMFRHLRHHQPDVGAEPPAPNRPRSICCHPDQYPDSTCASMVVELNDVVRHGVAWCSMATPCSGVFIPVPIGAPIPEPLLNGTGESAPWSVWWSMRHLQELVDTDREKLNPVVRETWRAWEEDLLREVDQNPLQVGAEVWSRVAKLQDTAMTLIDRVSAWTRGQGASVPN